MFNLRRKQTLISAFLLPLFFYLGKGYSQPLNLQGYDEKPFHFGFTMGINNNGFILQQSEKFTTRYYSNLQTINPKSRVGVGLGMLVNVRLEQFFDFRILPTVSFYQRQVEYRFVDSLSVQKVESVVMEIPLQIKYKSERRGNFRMYLIAGGKMGFDMASKVNVVDDSLKLKIGKQDIALEWGFGLDFYNTMFKFSPEIKWSYGIYDILVPENNVYSSTLQRLLSSTFLFSFHFE